MTTLHVPGVTVTEAKPVAAADKIPAYCDVRGTVVTQDSGVGDGLARFAMQMPETWQLRFQFRAILIPGRAAKSLAEHEAIVDAVRRHGPEHARIAMTQHLGQVIGTLRHAIVAQETLLGREVS